MACDGDSLTAVDAAAYRVPADQPEADATMEWDATTVVVVTVAAAGHRGLGWTYASAQAAGVVSDLLAPALRDCSPLDTGAAYQRMVRAVRNVGRSGIAATAISAVDLALWDLKARILGVRLSSLLGRVSSSVAVYGSGGFTTYDSATLARQLGGWVHEQGIGQVKIKIGEDWGTNIARDLARISQARRVIGEDAGLFVDANGGYSAHQAIRVAADFAQHDVTWFEEPVSSDDLGGLRRVRSSVTPDVTAGEYGCDLAYFERMCAADAVDCLQIDATRCGGVTGWLAASAVAAAHGLTVSAHCAPHAHLDVALATPNLRHIEWFHDHVRIEAMFFDGALDADGGVLRAPDGTVGNGLSLRDKDADQFRLR
jgi:L-alanine-DL-glutamate epimerase-like enolase superfamily enzyme